MKRNRHKDLLSIGVLKSWSEMFQANRPSDNYLDPLHAPSTWWENLPVGDVLITAGADEIFVDDDGQFADILRVRTYCRCGISN